MRSLTGAEWVATGLALALTLGTLGVMVAQQGELSEAAKQGRENRLKTFDLSPSK
jgi:hypothetical protein